MFRAHSESASCYELCLRRVTSYSEKTRFRATHSNTLQHTPRHSGSTFRAHTRVCLFFFKCPVPTKSHVIYIKMCDVSLYICDVTPIRNVISVIIKNSALVTSRSRHVYSCIWRDSSPWYAKRNVMSVLINKSARFKAKSDVIYMNIHDVTCHVTWPQKKIEMSCFDLSRGTLVSFLFSTKAALWLQNYIWRHVTYEWGLPHMIRARHMWVRNVTYEWVILCMNETWQVWVSHVMYDQVVSHTSEACHEWVSHVIHEWVLSHMSEPHHVRLSYVTYVT